MKEYIIQNYPEFKSELCFWVTGHSMGGGVANLVASKLIDDYYNLGGNRDNVYCYTFAAPNTFYRTDNTYTYRSVAFPDNTYTETFREPKASKYRCIFNIINDDDFVPKLPMEECEWTKYGTVAKKSIEKEIKPKTKGFTGPLSYNHYYTYVANTYKTNIFMIDSTINSFNSIFWFHQNNMRNYAYEFCNDYVYYDNSYSFEKTLGFYAKAYQKYVKLDNGRIAERQMPAFVMQTIANAVHGKVPEWKKRNGQNVIEIRDQDENVERNILFKRIKLTENQAVLYDAKFASFGMGASKLSMLIGEGLFKAIDHPHYLETYYTLSKEITTLDFK